jgi:dinuclear metal center YbgI/SA1388 family protein
MMKLGEVVKILERLAPPGLAESWDNVGLLAGDVDQRVSRILLTIDCTAAVLREAEAARCELVVAYHPPIFKPIKRLGPGDIAFEAIRKGIAIYSPHTALDSAPGGTCDVLADILGLEDRQPLRVQTAGQAQCKLVTFVPGDHVAAVSAAIFAAGAGHIGNYSSCSFRSEGTGTFFGQAQANPVVGQRGRTETVAEIKLESVLNVSDIGDVVAALRKAHPYEEPAFDLIPLIAPPTGIGMGRVGNLKCISRKAIVDRIKRALKLKRLLVAGPMEGAITRAAVCAGACDSFLPDALAAKAQLFLTGELRHHTALAAAAAGITVVCALHSNSERPALASLKARIQQAAPAIKTILSRVDHDPFSIV